MLIRKVKSGDTRSGEEHPFAWKPQAYSVPMASARQYQLKAAALCKLQQFNKTQITGCPVTIVVPAIFNFYPAESIALGWLNEIDALGAIRNRIVQTRKLTGWDVFTFHTRHNLDKFYASAVSALKETWLREGSLTDASVIETDRRFGPASEYNRLQGRLVENLVLQTSLMEWLTTHAADIPLRFHVVGTALMSGLVWSGALAFENAVRAAAKIGTHWDADLTAAAAAAISAAGSARAARAPAVDNGANGSSGELRPSGAAASGGPAADDEAAWLRFNYVRQVIEGTLSLSLGVGRKDLPHVEAPLRPFWFSATAKDTPVLIETSRDAHRAMEAIDFASLSPDPPRAIRGLRTGDRVRGWLATAKHPAAAGCRWSLYNYLLSTPSTALLFLEHIAALGRAPLTAPEPETFQNRARVARMKLTDQLRKS